MRVFLLVSSGGRIDDDAEARTRVMSELSHWYTELGDALVDGGAALTGHARTVTHEGEVVEDASPLIANGYTVVKARSIDDAVRLAQGSPLLRHGFDVSVLETFKEVTPAVPLHH